MKKILILPAMFVLLCACTGTGDTGKKLVVISSGKMLIDPNDNKTIVFEPGGQHNEQEVSFPGNDKVTVTVKMPTKNVSFELPDNGAFLLNLKTDTVVGGPVNYGSGGVPASITAEQLERMIDSTQKLMTGQNASDAAKTFFVPPNTIKRISTNKDATILSPYKSIPRKIEVDKDGNSPEMYKFFTNSQKREALQELTNRLKK